MSSDDAQSHFDFNDRYGIRPQRRWLPYAISLLILGTAWIFWAGLHQAVPAISSQLVAFDNENPRKVEIRYILTRRDSSLSATCILVARDFDKAIVGQVIDHIPATSGAVERTISIATRADAVNASISQCYLD